MVDRYQLEENIKAALSDVITLEKEWDKLSDRVLELEAERDALKEQIENPKMTYCAFCGEKYNLEDREKAIELITEHVSVCPKHPISALRAERDALKEDLETCRHLSDTFWDALKPLGLKKIYLSCPGQHIVDLINERDALKNKLEAEQTSVNELSFANQSLEAENAKLKKDVDRLAEAAKKVLKWRQGYRELKAALAPFV